MYEAALLQTLYRRMSSRCQDSKGAVARRAAGGTEALPPTEAALVLGTLGVEIPVHLLMY